MYKICNVLCGLEYEIKYRNTSQHVDALSRLPLPLQDGTEQDGMGTFLTCTRDAFKYTNPVVYILYQGRFCGPGIAH